MKRLTEMCRRLVAEEGQGLGEYGLILSMVVVIALIAVTLFGTRMHNMYQNNGNQVNVAITQSSAG